MTTVDTHSALNRLLVLHDRSLPMYLSQATPWSKPGQESLSQALGLIVASQRRLVDRINDFLMETQADIDRGRFPLRFASLHDLSYDFLVQQLAEHQERMIAEIERCLESLRLAPQAQALAQEALGEAKGHLDALREMAAVKPVATSNAV